MCPPDDDHHEVVEGVYERWRMRCDTDDCNIGDPRYVQANLHLNHHLNTSELTLEVEETMKEE